MESARPLQQGNTAAAYTAAAGTAPGIASLERNPKMVAGALRRKRLSDITNLATDGRASSFAGVSKVNSPVPAVFNKDAYAQLLKENNALMRALAERNNLIASSGAEIQKLQLMMQKLTLQNQQLARANSQMLAESNQDKERLKAFQHEIGCLQGVLKAKKMEELENVVKEPKEALHNPSQREALDSENDTMEQTKLDHVIQNPPLSADKKTASNTNRKHQCSNVSNHQVGAKVKDESPRKSSRRRSTSSKHDLCEPNENMLEVVGVSVHSQAGDDPMSRDITDQIDPSTPSVSNVSAYPVREEEEQEDPLIPANNKKTISNNRKRALCDQSLGSVVTVHQVGGKEKNDYRRKSSRRRSTVLKHDPCCPNENLFETEDEKFPVHSLTSDDPMRRASSSQVVPSAPSVSKEKDESTRLSSRRSSTGLKHDLCERNENLSEVEDVVPSPVSDDPMKEDTSCQVDPSAPLISNLSTYPVKEEHGLIGTPQVQDQKLRRSFGRPMRRATVKVNSYKEVPLNVKMRRE